MPTVYRFAGYRVVIYPSDHAPEHVRVVGVVEAVIQLNCPNGPIAVRENYGFKAKDIRHIEKELMGVIAHLCAEWRRIHG